MTVPTSAIVIDSPPLPVRHPVLGEVKYSATTIREDPDGQVEDTIALMRAYVIEDIRSEEHTSELQSHSFSSYAVFCLKKQKKC